MSWVEEVNENRKRQREALKTDINRKKKIIDDINQKRLAQQDSYNTLLLTSQADMGWFPAHSVEYTHMETKLDAQSAAFQIAQGRLMNHEIQIRDDLRNLELDYLPIRYISNQSNVKGHIIKKQNYSLGCIPHEDSYQLIQNTNCPSETEVLRHVSYEPESQLSNWPLSVFNLIHYANKNGASNDMHIFEEV